MTMTWTGRRLDSLTNGSATSFLYNSDGIRTRKTTDNIMTEYFLNGDVLVAEKRVNTTTQAIVAVIWYIYDDAGDILGLIYNGTPYYYLKNQQGDVISIVDADMNVVNSYTYDVWGKVLTATGEMAAINPIRYRGYYYDSETGLYYLNSRYYDPETGRFVNADGQISGVGGDIRGYNMFAYCMNNPVNMSDDNGNWPKWMENAVKVASVVVAAVAIGVLVAKVSAVVAVASISVSAVKGIFAATVFVGAALSGINGGVANEAKGNSYINGYLGGVTGGTIQGACSKTPIGTIVGGGVGVAVGTAITDAMNNLDPDSANSTAKEIASNAIVSGGKAFVTSSLTAHMGYASDLAAINGANGLMPSYTFGFGESVKIFFGWFDDAFVYIWE